MAKYLKISKFNSVLTVVVLLPIVMHTCRTKHLLASYQTTADHRHRSPSSRLYPHLLYYFLKVHLVHKNLYHVRNLELYFLNFTSSLCLIMVKLKIFLLFFFYLLFGDLLDSISMCWLFLSFSLLIWQPERARMRYKCK